MVEDEVEKPIEPFSDSESSSSSSESSEEETSKEKDAIILKMRKRMNSHLPICLENPLEEEDVTPKNMKINCNLGGFKEVAHFK